ncbi:hypothetical protein Leryth_007509 [Lithospermum erythrorhizon]|nr:hypothetical protein Leryth_007509 [Lithospermum erythrorhizon]
MKNVVISNWLKELPLAPEFRPTDTEFADPIAYISKIEKEASVFGICKVIPPLPKPSKKYVVHNLNKSLSKCPDMDCNVNVGNVENGGEGGNADVEVKAVFTTRHQELGSGSRKVKPPVGKVQGSGAQKQVWQSGEVYTLEQFEAKAKQFSRSLLGSVKDVSALVTEAMFWKAATEKPMYIEYANDVPGSGFAEPEGSFRYFRRNRRRRKRGTFDRNNRGDSISRDDLVDTVNSNSVGAGSFHNNSPNLGSDGSRDSSFLLSDEPTCPNRRRSSNDGVEAEGTAGWKLSNSPWNLQVIARSPGSLTRFMPDDIPGVTSPMVYLGMLFSWFAWHVEDHELHSLNFLHMGSAKTWYAVPGDYAFEFEEVIRRHAYGESTDRLAALTRLGEKTTLLSPEVVSASGIPCCRLVQNPGEFVVTFPRSYHVGFSHGFNCGEAANFGTPQWLAVAKEAAVRRAAMNFLPMLSHQQLLYLLTISFTSRIPRSLLPGVRSSRLKDRQKEERELLVKKAFIEDMLKENKLLIKLLHNCTSYRVVEWDLQSLSSSAKCSDLLSSIDTVATSSSENDCPEKGSNQDLCTQMSLYMDAIDDFYADDDGFLNDFQIDSGALPCVACGILGYPFMAIVQPSEKASNDLLNNKNVTQNSEANRGILSTLTSDLNSMVHGSSAVAKLENELPARIDTSLLNTDQASAAHKLLEGWNGSSGFLRPRLFCLEHAVQTERLLHARGGANILAICHSDFRKIKPHVLGVAEEAGIPFCYEEIPFDGASPEDLNLISLATESEEHNESSEHWTSTLCINLQQSMKLREQFPSTKVSHALTLNGLFAVSSQDLNNSSLIWELRKSRSKRSNKHPFQDTSMSYQLEKLEVPIGNTLCPLTGEVKQGDKNEAQEVKTDGQISCEVRKVIHYSRRYKPKPLDSSDKTPAANLDTLQDFQVDPTSENSVETNTRLENDVSPLAADYLSIPTQKQSRKDSLIEKADAAAKPSMPGISDHSVERCNKHTGKTGELQLQRKVVDSPTLSKKPETEVENDISRKPTLSSDSILSEEDLLTVVIGLEVPKKINGTDHFELEDRNNSVSKIEAILDSGSVATSGRKRRRELDLLADDQRTSNGFIKSPCEGLRSRARGGTTIGMTRLDTVQKMRKQPRNVIAELDATTKGNPNKKNRPHKCELDGCKMSFLSKAELLLHNSNRCTHEECGKKRFSSHKNLIGHQRVHDDNRPLKCPWEGCTMSFKWAWARTEHLRVHTGERPYKCKVDGCSLTFRFVSDYSRHRRKTGHYVD